jgi:hypothetical protein
LGEDSTGAIDINDGGAMVWDGLQWSVYPAYSDISLFKSKDDGCTWTLVWHMPASENGAPIAVVPQPGYIDNDSNKDAIFIATGSCDTGGVIAGGLGQGNLYRSMNGGSSFTRITPRCPAVLLPESETIVSLDVAENSGMPGTYMAIVGVSNLSPGVTADGVYTWNENNTLTWLQK